MKEPSTLAAAADSVRLVPKGGRVPGTRAACGGRGVKISPRGSKTIIESRLRPGVCFVAGRRRKALRIATAALAKRYMSNMSDAERSVRTILPASP